MPLAAFDDVAEALSAGAAFGADLATGTLADEGAEALAGVATAGMAVAQALQGIASVLLAKATASTTCRARRVLAAA